MHPGTLTGCPKPKGGTRMKNKQLEALIKKAAARATSEKGRKARFIDPTLEATKRTDNEGDDDRTHMFKEMKRREF